MEPAEHGGGKSLASTAWPSSSSKRVSAEIRRDVQAAQERDPAAKGASQLLVLLTWPGVHAVLAHRVAHALRGAGVPALPQILAFLARSRTGIEIHRRRRSATDSSSTTVRAW